MLMRAMKAAGLVNTFDNVGRQALKNAVFALPEFVEVDVANPTLRGDKLPCFVDAYTAIFENEISRMKDRAHAGQVASVMAAASKAQDTGSRRTGGQNLTAQNGQVLADEVPMSELFSTYRQRLGLSLIHI